MVKNLPARQKSWVQSLGWEGPMEKGLLLHSSILAWIVLISLFMQRKLVVHKSTCFPLSAKNFMETGGVKNQEIAQLKPPN